MSAHAATPFGGLRRRAFTDLCQVYDPLLADPEHDLAPPVRSELRAFARFFDLDLEGEADAEVWRTVRPRLEAEMAGGAEPVSSRPPGFSQPKVYLPADPQGGEAGGRAREVEAPSLTLLLAEDDPDLAAAVVEVLTEAGHELVGVATNLDQALTQAALHPFDLAVVDVELAKGDSGLDLARLLYDRWGVRSLFLSGARNEHVLSVDFAVGFVGKPFSGAQLLAALTLASSLIERA